MAPPRRYESPVAQLLELLRAAKLEGVPFDEAWSGAVRSGMSVVMSNSPTAPEGAIRWPTDPNDRVAWRHAIIETREAWQRAYEGLPATASDTSVSLLGAALEGGISLDLAVASAA